MLVPGAGLAASCVASFLKLNKLAMVYLLELRSRLRKAHLGPRTILNDIHRHNLSHSAASIKTIYKQRLANNNDGAFDADLVARLRLLAPAGLLAAVLSNRFSQWCYTLLHTTALFDRLSSIFILK